MAASASNRSRTRSRSGSNLSILHTVSRNLQAHRRQTRERLLPMRAKTSQACSPLEATGARICAHVAPVICQGLLADALSAAASSEDRCKGGCSLGQPIDPVSIPHDNENRGVATRSDQERNRQVSGAFQRSPQVTESARLNLSRWRQRLRDLCVKGFPGAIDPGGRGRDPRPRHRSGPARRGGSRTARDQPHRPARPGCSGALRRDDRGGPSRGRPV
jgi:hypothetical protein